MLMMSDGARADSATISSTEKTKYIVADGRVNASRNKNQQEK